MQDAIIQQIAIGGILQLFATLALAAWGRWVARRMGNGRLWRWVGSMPWVSLILLVSGTVAFVVALTRAFESTRLVDPAHRTQALALAIATAMNVSGLFLVPGYLLLAGSVLVFAIGSFSRATSTSPEIPLVAELRPEDLDYPFRFPVISLGNASITVHRAAASIGMFDEASVRRGEVPRIEVFTSEGRVWRPVRVRAFARKGVELFGKRLVNTSLELESARSFEVAELRSAARAIVDNDPDDVWNQVVTHEAFLETIEKSASFGDLVDALTKAGAVDSDSPPE